MKEFINMNLIWQVCLLEVAGQEWKTYICITGTDWCKKITEAHKMVPKSVQVVDHVVENSSKSSSNQRFIPYKVLIGKGITLNAQDSTVREDHASKINSHEFNLPAIRFLTYQKQKCINPCTKLKLCGCPVHYE